MKYTIWYGCYIDLLSKYGVASAHVEHDEKIYIEYFFKQDTTINELNLMSILIGLHYIPDGSEVTIIGCCRYAYQVLEKLSGWIRDEEIDVKCHSEILKEIWKALQKKGTINTKYFASRRADPMLWAISQSSMQHFRNVQVQSINDLKSPNGLVWHYNDLIHKEDFLAQKFLRPFTEIKMEKLIAEKIIANRRLEVANLAKPKSDRSSNVIQFPRLVST